MIRGCVMGMGMMLVMLSMPRLAAAQTCGQQTEVQFDLNGEPERIINCLGDCPVGAECDTDFRHTPHGGQRRWCDCDQDNKEPERDCHVVLIRLGKGEGGPKKILTCAGSECGVGDICLTGQQPDVIAIVPGPPGKQRKLVSCCRTRT